jgi:hypothetical protein
MYRALDCATDELTPAVEALPRRLYRCARCQARVKLHVGLIIAPYFAHAVGQADPDCEEYFPSRVVSTGRRLSFGGTDSENETPGYSDLRFEMAHDGPRLSLWLPECPEGTPLWSGSIQVIAHQLTRTLTAQHLHRGQLVVFPLVDGQWTVSAVGQVSDTYLSQLEVGPNSLESGLNVFDATRVPGRRLGPAHTLRLRDAVWVVTRDIEFAKGSRGTRVNCEFRGSVGGWRIHYLELPAEAAPDEVRIISGWLQRRVRFARARVWVERPWPVGYTPAGVPIFPLLPVGIEIRSNQSVDLAIVETRTRETIQAVESVNSLHWVNPRYGSWEIQVNAQPFQHVWILEAPPIAAAPVRVVLDDSKEVDLFAGQTLLEKWINDLGTLPAALIKWSSPAVGRLLRVDGKSIPDSDSIPEIELVGRLGALVDGANFGELRWPPCRTDSAVRRAPKEMQARHLIPKARWLLSVSEFRSNASASLTVPSALRTIPCLGALTTRSWAEMFRPQLQAFQREMEKLA